MQAMLNCMYKMTKNDGATKFSKLFCKNTLKNQNHMI